MLVIIIVFVLVVKVDHKQTNKIASQVFIVGKWGGVRKYEGIFTIS